MRPRCTLIVFSLVPSSDAICLFSRPLATMPHTSRSRFVSLSHAFIELARGLLRLQPLLVLHQRARDRIEQLRFVHRLDQKIDGAAAHRPGCGRDVTRAAEKDNRDRTSATDKLGLQIEAAQYGQLQVEDETRGHVAARKAIEKRKRRVEGFDGEARRADEPFQRTQHCWIVIDDKDVGLLIHCGGKGSRDDIARSLPTAP